MRAAKSKDEITQKMTKWDGEGFKFLIKSSNCAQNQSILANGRYLNNCICREHLKPDWPLQMHGDVNALNSAGWDAVKIDSCGPSHDLEEWAELLNATGKAIQIENCEFLQREIKLERLRW